MTRIINVSLIAATSLLFTACTSSNTPAPVVQSPSFKLGAQDGCTTASGAYTKNSEAFNNDKEYQNGWYAGRKNCNPSQVQS
jgi:hypothetical protein